MKAENPKVLTHTWHISGTIPNPDQKYPNYGQNVSIGVEADSMEVALAAARKIYPSLVVFNAHHRGPIHVRA